MKKLLLILVCLSTTVNYSNSKEHLSKSLFSYVDPLPGSNYINKQTCITFRPAEALDDASLFRKNSIKISGNNNTNYSYTIKKSASSNTYIIQPANPFNAGERITVSF